MDRRGFSLFPIRSSRRAAAWSSWRCGSALYDTDRFGAALPRFTPRQADLLMVMSGTISHKEAPILKKVCEPDVRAEVGDGHSARARRAAASSQLWRARVSTAVIPVDIYVPGLPATGPRPRHRRHHDAAGQDRARHHPILPAGNAGASPRTQTKVFPIFPPRTACRRARRDRARAAVVPRPSARGESASCSRAVVAKLRDASVLELRGENLLPLVTGLRDRFDFALFRRHRGRLPRSALPRVDVVITSTATSQPAHPARGGRAGGAAGRADARQALQVPARYMEREVHDMTASEFAGNGDPAPDPALRGLRSAIRCARTTRSSARRPMVPYRTRVTPWTSLLAHSSRASSGPRGGRQRRRQHRARRTRLTHGTIQIVAGLDGETR